MDKESKEAIKQELKVKEKENVEIRDSLAIERTKFANERTFLAYIRTAMALIIAGFSLMNFFRDDIYKFIGVLFIPIGIGAGIYGFRRFRRKKLAITQHKQAYTPTSKAHAEIVNNSK